MQKRRRVVQTTSLEDRLEDKALRLRETAKSLPPGIERDDAIRRALQTETASLINSWLRTPGSRCPL